jgi:modification methylase
MTSDIETNIIHLGECLENLRKLPDCSIDCIVTSPPYNKKGLQGTKTNTYKEPSANGKKPLWHGTIDYKDYDDNLKEEDYQKWQVQILNECHRVLKDNGSLFYNHKQRRHLGVSLHPLEITMKSKMKLYQEITWDKMVSPNMNNTFLYPRTEIILWLRKDPKETESTKLKVNKSNLHPDYRSEVWRIIHDNSKHPAPFPLKLAENCILLGTDPGDIVLDPFMGSGTTAVAAVKNNRRYIGFDITQDYIDMANNRIQKYQHPEEW